MKHKFKTDFVKSLSISKFSKCLIDDIDYKVTIEGNDYYIQRHKGNVWCAYDLENSDYYAVNHTRSAVLRDILSGLWWEYNNTKEDSK